MKYYHAHIYFEPNDLESARALRASADLIGLFGFVKFHEHPVGPHATGMIEAHFTELVDGPVMAWLQNNRGTFSVLVHQDTGDDVRMVSDGWVKVCRLISIFLH